MDRVAIVKEQVRKEQWKKLISECQASGVSVRSWCETNGICVQTYYRNLRRFREEICESLPIPATEPENPAVFKKLEVQTPAPSLQAAVIIHLSAATIEVRNGTSQQTVEAVLLALKNIC